MVQAANGAALVGIDDNKAAYYSLASDRRRRRPDDAATATPPATGAYGSTVNVTANLTQGAIDLAAR